MSATSEKLAEELRVLEQQLAAATAAGNDTSALLERKRVLVERLQAANASLTEGSQVLKG